MRSLALMLPLLLGGCEEDMPSTAPPVPNAVLHRLTEVQVNHAIGELFLVDEFEGVRLPRDIAVHGFDNNELTREPTLYLVESLQRDMQRIVAERMTEPGPWLHCEGSGGPDPQACGRSTLRQFTRRAFRRQLRPEEDAWIQGLFDDWYEAHGFAVAMQLSLQTILQSPDFLYLVEVGDPGRAEVPGVTPLTGWEIASRLSFLLWDSMPDEELFELAATGELLERPVVFEQARRMIQDPRAHDAIVRFHRQWLGFSHIDGIQLDTATYFPGEDDEEELGGLVTEYKLSLEEEFDRNVKDAILGPEGTLAELLTSRRTWVSEVTAEVYGVSYDEEQGEIVWREVGMVDEYDLAMFPVTLPAKERAGILTSAAFLAGHSHPVFPSPVLRSVFIRERLLCQPTPSPPDDVPPIENSEMQEPRTNRERYEIHRQNPACTSCHDLIDGTGMPFESYDSMGRFRTTDNGYPVDTSGTLLGTDMDAEVSDAIELVERLARSRTVHDCAVRQWWRYAMHRSERPEDEPALLALQQRFWDGGGVVPNLLVDLAVSDAFLTRKEGSR